MANFTTGQEFGHEVLVHVLEVEAGCQLGLQSSEGLMVPEVHSTLLTQMQTLS